MREKGRAKRVGWASRMGQLAMILGIVGGTLIILNVFEIVDLYEIIGRLRGFMAGLT